MGRGADHALRSYIYKTLRVLRLSDKRKTFVIVGVDWGRHIEKLAQSYLSTDKF